MDKDTKSYFFFLITVGLIALLVVCIFNPEIRFMVLFLGGTIIGVLVTIVVFDSILRVGDDLRWLKKLKEKREEDDD